MDLTKEQWECVRPVVPLPTRKPGGKGRPPHSSQDILNGIFWVIRSGMAWKDLPERYPPHKTCHRWFQNWVKKGVFQQILVKLSEDLNERGDIDVREMFSEDSFTIIKDLATMQQTTAIGTGPRSWQTQTLMIFNSPITFKALHSEYQGCAP